MKFFIVEVDPYVETVHEFPDDSKHEQDVIDCVKRIVEESGAEFDEVFVIRGERWSVRPPEGDYTLKKGS